MEIGPRKTTGLLTEPTISTGAPTLLCSTIPALIPSPNSKCSARTTCPKMAAVPGIVNVVTRSGTDAFHGSAYEFFRNDVLAANNFFNNAAVPKIARPPLRWNDFGFTIGGPIAKTKTFFFYSQEWRRVITYQTFTSGELPTPAELGGTLPIPVCTSYDSAGNCSTTGTSIPNVNPVAAAYIKDIFAKLPALTNIADQTITSVGRNTFNYREESLRIDHTFSSKLSLFGRYLDDSIPTQEPGGLFTGLGVPGVATTSTNSPGRN